MELHPATLWEAIADAIPERTALVQGAVRHTCVDLDARASRLAGSLLAAGVQTGNRVGLMLHNCPEFVKAYFAALKIRAVPFNVNDRYTATEAGYLLAVDDDGPGAGTDLDFETAARTGPPAARIDRDPTDVTMIYTGGTTDAVPTLARRLADGGRPMVSLPGRGAGHRHHHRG